MAVEDTLRSVVERRKEQDPVDRGEKAHASLSRSVRKKITTAFVGALARFEEYFGAAWGRGKPIHDCSPAELEARAVWDECRKAVLDNGNTQARGAEQEIGGYEVSRRKTRTEFKPAG